MEEVIKIKGNKLLKGAVDISGSKNLCVALLPAALLAQDIVTIHNIPPISDVYNLIDILEVLNARVIYKDDVLIIDSSNIKYSDLTIETMHKLRASYYFYSVMLGLFKKLKTYGIGGCRLGSRPIDLHLKAFEILGVIINSNDDTYEFDGAKMHKARIVFEKSSVGATINTLLLATQIKGKTIIENAAQEPEITELIKYLKQMGADIYQSESTIVIDGGKKMHGTEFTNIPDRIEAGTYALIGAAVGDKLKIRNIVIEHIQSLLDIFDVLEVNYRIEKNNLIVSKSKITKGIVILTSPYPGFPTDLQQPLTTFLSVNKGTSVIIESIYDNRFAHIKELNRMGANIQTTNMNIIIHGVEELNGTVVSGKDLRGAASLVLAGLMAKGETIVSGLEYINRGYENMIKKLKKLHAKIELSLVNIEENEDAK
ncbi:MAG: UDP-N-acetylglucosamine 1-carboxyvinyltransferase [Erysipelotrichaceae bacterium]|nr:UDP-N-acetylglucosamine 1-carboxyvinyltransferase [Erysipelotrichaceae bacterium]